MTKEDIKAQVRQAFDYRVSIRVYNDKDIPREDMEYILDMAWLGSAHHLSDLSLGALSFWTEKPLQKSLMT